MPDDRRPLVRYDATGHVAVATLDAPPANTYSHEMMLDLDACILKARFDPAVQVIVITGAGDRFFCAGADIGMLESADPTFKYYFCLHANETISRLEQTPKLVIAALNGHTVGGGLEVALAADIRVARADCGRGPPKNPSPVSPALDAADDVAQIRKPRGCLGSSRLVSHADDSPRPGTHSSANPKFGLPEVALGVLPGTGGTQRLVRMLGKSKAIELMVAGRTFGTEEALELGIINQVFDGDDFMGQVMDYARSFTTPGKATMAVGHIKRSVQTGAELPLEAGLAFERELQARLFASHDAAEGIRAYNEKRKANFEGR